MKRLTISVDQSIRSTGICAFFGDELVDFSVIKTEKTSNEIEEVTLYDIASEISGFIYKNINEQLNLDHKNINFVIEGLSFMGKSSTKDLLYGLQWVIRCNVYNTFFPNINVGRVPVTAWRNWFVGKDLLNQHKKIDKNDSVKIATVVKVGQTNINDLKNFENYIKENNYTSDTIFDLCDAYGLGKYRINLSKEN